jgi:hypothetical protein
LLSATNTVIANQNSTIDNYNTRYTPQGRIKAGKRGTYKKDIHVWVYTSAFAKRFGMPQEWVDDELKLGYCGHKKALDLRPYILAYLALLFQGKLALSSIYISTTHFNTWIVKCN